ncbi:hypothetical protein FAES_2270 [Fibrella aestuarina BUZ 2]|uniref:Uncharacterized protein n=1 Tax=Fibrella aestuarina BUZ 2 TaxID=1166018 RepID=I0K826_9BACT|nr:hypothetical protein [Fibrella aestuarina]CCH00279.1 hypothetical protein FAES_2270 [Fibrella aestuarina BUZ 2]
MQNYITNPLTQHARVQTYQTYAARLLRAKLDERPDLVAHYRNKMATTLPARS